MTDDEDVRGSSRAPRRYTWGDAVLTALPFLIVLYAGGKFAALPVGEQDRVEPFFQLSLLAGAVAAGAALWLEVRRPPRPRRRPPTGLVVAGAIALAIIGTVALRGPARPSTFVVLGASAGFMFVTMVGYAVLAWRDRRRARGLDPR